MGRATGFLTVEADMGAGVGFSTAVHGYLAWLRAPLVARALYALVPSFEVAVSR